MDRNLKYKYYKDFNKIRTFVNEFDPCGFIHFGAPEDEYDCLTNHLLNSVYEHRTRDEIRSLILHEIDNHFGFPDRTVMSEIDIQKLDGDIEILIDKLEQYFYKQPSR